MNLASLSRQVVYRGASAEGTGSTSGYTRNNNNHSHGHSSNNSNGDNNGYEDKNVLSMKKSAEIAAVFSGAKINQTTDIVEDGESDQVLN